jgi:hypothetical protein
VGEEQLPALVRVQALLLHNQAQVQVGGLQVEMQLEEASFENFSIGSNNGAK